jgi:hypothetical protein
MFFAVINASIWSPLVVVFAPFGAIAVHSPLDMLLLSLILHHSATFCSAALFVMLQLLQVSIHQT